MPKNDREQKWLDCYMEGMDGTNAAKAAGYSEKSAKQSSMQLRERFEEYIYKTNSQRMKGKASLAIECISNLVKTAKQESVRLKAATTLLNYAGYKPVEKQEVLVTQRTEEEIDAALKGLLGDKADAVLGSTKH